MFNKNVFSHEEIENAKNYKYSGVDDSIFAKLFLRRYWNWLIEFFPLTMAPNTITFIGFMFEVTSFIISLIYSEMLTKPLPGFVCILNGVFLHIYQTLDNLDGRQARRTGNSSALGQFFDHGCDAITGVIELMKVAMSFSMMCSSSTFFFIFLMGIGFFLTSWEEYVTHSFYLGYINGADEGLVLLSAGQIIVGLIPALKSIAHITFFKFCFLCGAFGTIIPIFYNVIKQSISDKEKMSRMLISIIPASISTTILLAVALSGHEPWSSPFFIMSAGLILQYQSQQTIVAYLTKRPPNRLFDITIVGLWIFAAVTLLVHGLIANTYYWMFYFLILFGAILLFDVNTICGLSAGLQIPIFSLKEKPEEHPEDQIMIDQREEVFQAVPEPEVKEVPLNIFQDPK